MGEISRLVAHLAALAALNALVGHMKLGLSEGVRLIFSLAAVGVVLDMLVGLCAL